MMWIVEGYDSTKVAVVLRTVQKIQTPDGILSGVQRN
jgi:hypothetical protein